MIHPLWRNANNNEWYGQGRQGLVNQVNYDTSGKPTSDYPINAPKPAPKLPSSGIPWMVPHSDFFNSAPLNPEWSFLGYTPDNTYSLTDRPGWLHLSPKGKINTVIKNDGEHNYSIITALDFAPKTLADQAVGLIISPYNISCHLGCILFLISCKCSICILFIFKLFTFKFNYY